jgi:hypothetical protein
LRFRRRDHRRLTPGRLGLGALHPPPLQRARTEQRDHARKNGGRVHGNPLFNARASRTDTNACLKRPANKRLASRTKCGQLPEGATARVFEGKIKRREDQE